MKSRSNRAQDISNSVFDGILRTADDRDGQVQGRGDHTMTQFSRIHADGDIKYSFSISTF